VLLKVVAAVDTKWFRFWLWRGGFSVVRGKTVSQFWGNSFAFSVNAFRSFWETVFAVLVGFLAFHRFWTLRNGICSKKKTREVC
jgi:hypothetical protein